MKHVAASSSSKFDRLPWTEWQKISSTALTAQDVLGSEFELAWRRKKSVALSLAWMNLTTLHILAAFLGHWGTKGKANGSCLILQVGLPKHSFLLFPRLDTSSERPSKPLESMLHRFQCIARHSKHASVHVLHYLYFILCISKCLPLSSTVANSHI